MIMPIMTSLSREVFSLTPIGEKEGALALGADQDDGDPSGSAPLRQGGSHRGASMLGLGRALGETVVARSSSR